MLKAQQEGEPQVPTSRPSRVLTLGRFVGRAAHAVTGARRRIGTLIVLPGGLGDALLFTGSLRRIVSAFGPCKVVCSGGAQALLAPEFPEVRFVPLFRTPAAASLHGRWSEVSMASDVLGCRYERVLHPAFSTLKVAHDICGLADAPVKVWFRGAASDGDEVPFHDPVALYSGIVEADRDAHELDKAVRFLQHLGLSDVRTRDDLRPFLRCSDREAGRSKSMIGECAGTEWGSALRVAVCAGARFRKKDWGFLNYLRVLEQLGNDRQVLGVLLGDQEDREVYEAALAGGGGGQRAPVPTGRGEAWRMWAEKVAVVNLAGRLSVRESVAAIADCGLCIGNDTFGLHAAIVVGTPSVVVMGGGDFPRWIPWGDPARHRMANLTMECFHCGWRCRYPECRCVKEIPVEQVADQARAALRTSGIGCRGEGCRLGVEG